MKESENVETILFDLDGTLLDSIGGVKKSLNHVITKFSPSSSLTADDLIVHVGKPLRDILGLLEHSHDSSLETLVRAYLDHNQKIIPSLKLFEGISLVLRNLSERGFKLGIVTSKRRDSTDISVREFNLEQYFTVILTSDDSQNHKPHPEPILRAIESLDSDVTKTIYVGDAIYDIQAARAAGCLSAAALWGTLDAEKLVNEKPSVLFNHPQDILSFLKL